MRVEHREPLSLLAIFFVLLALSALYPWDRLDWALEASVPLLAAVVLVATYRWFRFTSTAYRAMFVEAVILLVGAHYTHEHVPVFDWIKPFTGWQRNHYDRFAHFAVGLLLAFPIRELLERLSGAGPRASRVLTVVSVLALAGFYEITEWWIAVLASSEVGDPYLGAQGDVWDAQKDMLLDALGAIASVTVLAKWHGSSTVERH